MLNAGGKPGFDITRLIPALLIRRNQIRGTAILTRLVDAANDPIALTEAANRLDAEMPALPVTQFIVR